jgi:hypothetical protein
MNDGSWIAARPGMPLIAALAFLAAAGACSSGSTGDAGVVSHGGSTAGSSGGSTAGSSSGSTAAGGSTAGGSGGRSTIGSGGSSGSAGTAGAAATGGSSGSGGNQAVGSGGPFYVSPTGTGTACSSAAPCSLTQAQITVRAAVSTMQMDITVELVDGVYSLVAPLVFTAADSGANGHQVIWQAASGAHPMLSGGKRVTGWAVSDAGKNIWKASAPSAFATRQLYVDGKLATRARSSSISRSDMTINDNGWTFSNSSLNYLKNLSQPQRAELNVIGSWTNRYSPIQGVASNSVTMVQPAWQENTWGYDTVQSPYRQGPIYVENDYTLLDQPGEWYQDTAAGALYYIPLSG